MILSRKALYLRYYTHIRRIATELIIAIAPDRHCTSGADFDTHQQGVPVSFDGDSSEKVSRLATHR
jgi:hypothetical protein